jgi:hypothetical protein
VEAVLGTARRGARRLAEVGGECVQGKRTRSRAGARQWVKDPEAKLVATGEVQRCLVGSGRERRTRARQVFDGTSFTRARSRQNERSRKLEMACKVRLGDV